MCIASELRTRKSFNETNKHGKKGMHEDPKTSYTHVNSLSERRGWLGAGVSLCFLSTFVHVWKFPKVNVKRNEFIWGWPRKQWGNSPWPISSAPALPRVRRALHVTSHCHMPSSHLRRIRLDRKKAPLFNHTLPGKTAMSKGFVISTPVICPNSCVPRHFSEPKSELFGELN